MRTAMRRDLTEAMKARDRIAVAALRSALAAIENAETVDAPSPADAAGEGSVAGSTVGLGTADVRRRLLAPGDVAELLRAEIQDRRSAAQGYEQLGRLDDAHRLRAEADVLAAYLPSS